MRVKSTRVFILVLSLLLPLACTQAPVTSGGVEVTNQAVMLAVRTVGVTEKALVVGVDSLTLLWQKGHIGDEVVQHFQAKIAPKITAALSAVHLALKVLNDAPGQTQTQAVLEAVLSLQGELTNLQGFVTNHTLIGVGVPK